MARPPAIRNARACLRPIRCGGGLRAAASGGYSHRGCVGRPRGGGAQGLGAEAAMTRVRLRREGFLEGMLLDRWLLNLVRICGFVEDYSIVDTDQLHRASVPLGMPALPLKSLVSLGDLLGFDTPELEAITAMRGMSGSSSS
ncbi:unnamed protein product [Miscanthus lutarioriparius]|uniref:Uncharacterized protein n=1 Tax=Miscanthus lutarioriparius TaxID=422564 RepID=A0A811NPY7_9POAL|nr:unnamed protein product [Miscanthus lutarioriparius]